MNRSMLKNLLIALLAPLLMVGCASSSGAEDSMEDQARAEAEAARTAREAQEQNAQRLAGHWRGKLALPGNATLTIVFHLDYQGDARWEATMDSPDQGARGIPVDKVTLEGDAVTLSASAIQGTYKGTLNQAGDKLEGTWTQGGADMALNLERISEEQANAPHRPQEPQPPFPYTIEDVTFPGGRPTAGTTDAVTLAGTLTMPETPGPHPAVILLTGSGPQDRDETLMGHKPFWVIADFLSRNGVAVLRIDDRGFAQSTGVFDGATIADFVTDATAALDFLSAHEGINPKAIGLLGHSEGANVAPMTALASNKVSFLILLAPTAVPGTELLARQNRLILHSVGMSEDGAKAYEKAMLKILNKIVKKPLNKPLPEDFRKEVRANFKAAADAMTPEDRAVFGPADPDAFEQVLDAMLTQLGSGWMRSFLAMKPDQVFSKVTKPTLALYGSKDIQVPAEQNAGQLKKSLAKNKKATVTTLAGLNHLFQPTETGHITEYASIPTTISPDALNAILAWMSANGWAQQADKN